MLFDSSKHRYTFNNEIVPSVTTILSIMAKPALIQWAANMATESIATSILAGQTYDELELFSIFETAKKAHTQKKKDAGGFGTLVHNWIEDYIHGKKPAMPINPQLRESIEQFLDWQKTYKVKFSLSEEIVFSKKYKYVGTLDFLCTIDGDPYIGDTKTSNAIYAEYGMQTSAYRFAREEEFPEEKYKGQVIIRVGKEGDFEFAVIDKKKDYTRMLQAFLLARSLYDHTLLLKDYKFKSL